MPDRGSGPPYTIITGPGCTRNDNDDGNNAIYDRIRTVVHTRHARPPRKYTRARCESLIRGLSSPRTRGAGRKRRDNVITRGACVYVHK